MRGHRRARRRVPRADPLDQLRAHAAAHASVGAHGNTRLQTGTLQPAVDPPGQLAAVDRAQLQPVEELAPLHDRFRAATFLA